MSDTQPSPQLQQWDCIGSPPARTWSQFRDGVHGAFNGGHHDEMTRDAFHHGMDTVLNCLEGIYLPDSPFDLNPRIVALTAQRDALLDVIRKDAAVIIALGRHRDDLTIDLRAAIAEAEKGTP